MGKKAKEFMRRSKSLYDDNDNEEEQQLSDDGDDDLMEDDEEKIFVDEIKFLLRLLHDNICTELPDSMDHSRFVDDHVELLASADENQRIVEILQSASPQKQRLIFKKKGNEYRRLRASIKRKASERIFRWLNVGCGSCFLHENSGRAIEIGPAKHTDYESAFPAALQRAMFFYFIDCRVPFNEEIIDKNYNECSICSNLIIHPADIGNPDACSHIFCKLCIQQWSFVELDKLENKKPKSKTCPLCRAPIKKIQVKSAQICKKMKQGIPSTIYSQLRDENQSRFLRKYLVDQYLNERERALQNEQNDNNQNQSSFGQQIAGNQNYAFQAAGYNQ